MAAMKSTVANSANLSPSASSTSQSSIIGKSSVEKATIIDVKDQLVFDDEEFIKLDRNENYGQNAASQIIKPNSKLENVKIATKDTLSEDAKTIKFELSRQQRSMLGDNIARILQNGKGILAADDMPESIGIRLNACDLVNSAENRRRYRQLLFTTPNLAKHISAVILHDETFRQCTDKGELFVDILRRQGIAVGIKIDCDLAPLIPATNFADGPSNGETITQGLDNLMARAIEYKAGGCSFAKWRCAYRISEGTPSKMALEQNAMTMGRYAMICQHSGIVPIVEPDVSCDGQHPIENCQRATEQVLAHIFKSLADHAIYLEGIVIKMNMVTSGLQAFHNATPEHVAEETLKTLRRTIPTSVPGISFLSGGQTELVATQNLSAINKLAGPSGTNTKPWQLTFCFGRALQANVMEIWQGESENVGAAQKQLLHRAKANADAEQGNYEGEKAVAVALSGLNILSGVPSRYY